MTTQYKNIKEYLSTNNYTLECSLEKFLKDKIVVFKCGQNHINEIKNTSFINKKVKYQNQPEKLCEGCNFLNEKFQNYKNKIFEKCGHTLLSLEKGRKIKYICGNCKTENQSFINNLLSHNMGTCPKCQRDRFKNDKDDIKKIVEKENQTLIEYSNCKDLTLRCEKEHIYKTTLHLFNIGRRCPDCRIDRTKETNLQRYGVENVFQSEEIKEKIRNTNIKKYGDIHPNKNPEMLKKCIDASFVKKEFVFPSGRKEYVLGYEDICITELLKTYGEDDIITDPVKIPVINYLRYDDDKPSKYYPDIKLPNKLIEVKSTYTYDIEKENNERKFTACRDCGYTLEVWVYNRRKELVETHIYEKDKPTFVFIE